MFRNMVTSLFEYGKVRTTDAKAKELRRWADHIVTLAKQNFELAEQKRLGEDVTQTIETRISATERARDIVKEQGETAVAFAQRQLDLERQRLEGLTLTDEEETRLFELEAALYQARQEAAEKDIELQNKFNQLLKEQNELRKKEVIELLPRRGIQIEKNADAETDALKRVEEQQKINVNTTLKGEQAKQSSTLGSIQAALLEGIARTAGSAPFPFNVVLVGLATTFINGLRTRIESEISALSPTLPTFADGGMIYGPSHAGGGVLIEAEGGEGIINKRSMSIPWVKRQASYLNQIGGGVPMYQDGGTVPLPNTGPQFVPVLSIPEFLSSLDQVQTVQEIATL